ncbi:LysR family transcriptional regulator [Ornithinimicrobium faecis]|uniref:LysR family transcriptional regulator n=1 Tax=Ornithinimicrobium faecis TaxID=2934158 RepID=UPI0021189CF6|nr:LysR family transcriptional regulator [Ornithinimicrobium sp. HY1745]
MIDVMKLEAFVAVAEEESFGGAADRVRVAQSTISSRIKELEAHLGQPLFIRSSRQVRLSAAGEAALPAARAALNALTAVSAAVDDVAGIRRGRVRLGLVSGADVPELGSTLAAFAADHPGIELAITSASTEALDRAVAEGSVDIALVVRASPSPLPWQELLRDPLTVVGLPSAPGRAPLSALIEHPLIVLDAGAGARAALEAAARRSAVHLTVGVDVSSPGLAHDLYRHGMGLLVVPQSLAPAPGAVLVETSGAEIEVRVGLTSQPGAHTPASALLLDRLVSGIHLGTPT